MKALLVFVFVFCWTFLSAATLLSEDFTSATFPPAGWTVEGPQPGAWGLSTNNYAGGTGNEARLNWTPSGYGTYRLISPPIDTRKVHDMTLSFRHMFDHYDLQETVSLAVELAHDPTAFDWELWYVAPTTDIAATQVTVPISFDLGISETTYISFVFRGNNWDIQSWYIDDIVLTYNNTLGSGTWPSGQYYPTGDVIIPNGHTLTLEAGTELYLSYDAQIAVQGRILANGTENQQVKISSTDPNEGSISAGVKFLNTSAVNDSSIFTHTLIRGSHYSGLKAVNFDKIRLSNCIIRNNTSSDLYGGGIYLDNSDIVIENCEIFDNYCANNGSAIYCLSASPVIRHNSIYENSSAQKGAIWLESCNVSDFHNNIIANNYDYPPYPALWLYNSNVTAHHNLIANNNSWGVYVFNGIVELTETDIVNNGLGALGGTSPDILISNSIIWGNNVGISNYYQSGMIITYSCLQGGLAGILDSGMLPGNYLYNIESDPLFVNATAGFGVSYNALTADWNLQYNSPCIDTGNPLSSLDPDGSRTDIGMYPRALKPILTKAADVPFDQGRKLYLRWDRSDIDTAFYPNAYYSVWRWNPTRSENRTWIANPTQLDFASGSNYENVSFRDGDRTWDYLGVNVPAINLSDYGVNVDTEQDSSSTGTHEADYMVVYQNNNGFWMSLSINGYSVDNIPPYAPSRPDISRAGIDTYNLTWDEVTEGGWEGNSYPEINLITYKIYSGNTPDFELNPSTYLISTTDPYAVLNNQTAELKFYKIIASDSE